MTPKECVQRIAKLFPEKFSEIGSQDIVEYLEKLNLGSIQTEIFYTTFTDNYDHQHRYFPTLKAVKEIWHGRGSSKEGDFSQWQPEACIQKYKQHDIYTIINKVREIQGSGTMLASEVLFVGAWGELSSIYGHLIDLDWEQKRITPYLQKIKADMVAGNEIFFDVTIHAKDLGINLKDDRDYVGKTPRPTKHISGILP